jgi:tRNA 2-thiocytidine biosynthesis protein TtcA
MTKLHRTLNARIDKAAWEYQMFAAGDRILLSVSGGADSMALLDVLSLHVNIYAQDLKLFAVYIDLGFGHAADSRCDTMKNFLEQVGVEGQIVRTDIGVLAHSEYNRENPCFLCSRMRRKRIFECAEQFGCQKILFGHHKDDIVETLLLNMIFGREISTMTPRLPVFKGKYTILRPLVFVEEVLLKKYCRERNLPVIDQECPTDGNSKRQYVKDLLNKMECDFKGTRENIFASMKRVKKEYLL